jgi:hypothetical protein
MPEPPGQQAGPSQPPVKRKSFQVTLTGFVRAREENRPLTSSDIVHVATKNPVGRPRKTPKTGLLAVDTTAATREDIHVADAISPPAAPVAPLDEPQVPALPPQNPTLDVVSASSSKKKATFKYSWVQKVCCVQHQYLQ